MKTMLQLWICASVFGFMGAVAGFLLFLFGLIDFDAAFYIWSGATMVGAVVGSFGGTELLQTSNQPTDLPTPWNVDNVSRI